MNKKRLVSLGLSSFIIYNLILSTTIVYVEDIDVEMLNIDSIPILENDSTENEISNVENNTTSVEFVNTKNI